MSCTDGQSVCCVVTREQGTRCRRCCTKGPHIDGGGCVELTVTEHGFTNYQQQKNYEVSDNVECISYIHKIIKCGIKRSDFAVF